MYIKLAIQNMKKSIRNYVIYFVTITLTAAMMYSFLALGFSKRNSWSVRIFFTTCSFSPFRNMFGSLPGNEFLGIRVQGVIVFFYLQYLLTTQDNQCSIQREPQDLIRS